MAFKPIDNKRDSFRKYLETTGVIEVLSKSITKLMESQEKPESAVDFIRENMGLTQKEVNQIEFLKEEVEIYKKQVNDLKLEIAGLKQERQEIVQNGPAKDIVAADATVKEDVVAVVPDNQATQPIETETKKSDEAEPNATVLAAVAAEEKSPKKESADEVSADQSVVVEVTEAKVDTKPEEIKADDKPATAVVVAAAAAPAGDAAPAAPETTDK